MQDLISLPVGAARARVYAEGWQSWSYTCPTSLAGEPWRPRSPNAAIMHCQDGVVPDGRSWFGCGLVALDPGDGSPVEVIGAVDAVAAVPQVRLRLEAGRAVVAVAPPCSPRWGSWTL